MIENCNNEQNTVFKSRNLTQVIVEHLIEKSPNLWKLLFYTKDTDMPLDDPINCPNLILPQISEMICSTPSDYLKADIITKKNILFTKNIQQAMSISVPQLRIETNAIRKFNPYNGGVTIDFQIVIPYEQQLFQSSYSSVADRADAIFYELAQALEQQKIANSYMCSEFFMNIEAPHGMGRGTGSFREVQNSNYNGRLVTMAVLF